MLDIDLERVLRLVAVAVEFETPWEGERVSSDLVGSGCEPFGSVSLPYPKRLRFGDLLLGVEQERGAVAVGVTLKEWGVDWNSADYIVAVSEGYEKEIGDCQELASRLELRLGQIFSFERKAPVLDGDEFPFIHVQCWKIAGVYVTLGLEHLDPSDAPIRVSLYLSQGFDG